MGRGTLAPACVRCLIHPASGREIRLAVYSTLLYFLWKNSFGPAAVAQPCTDILSYIHPMIWPKSEQDLNR
jgi:hypothetical protein